MKLNSSEKRIGIILILVGFLFIVNNLTDFDLWESVWKLSPLLLVWWGFHILRKRGTEGDRDSDFQVFGDMSTTTSSPFVKHSSAFGDIRIKIDNNEFSGGSISSVFGKISLDLQSVQSIGSYGQLDLHSVFGDITIRVPEGLEYEIRGSNLFGSITTDGGTKVGGHYASPGFEAASQKLIIKPSLVFGDFELLR